MSINSRAKGARFERAVLKILEAATGLRGRRTSDGYSQAARGDIIHPLLENYSVECKHREQIALKDWIKQSEHDAAGTGDEPIVIWRTNKLKPRVDLTLDHFIELLLKVRNGNVNPSSV